MAAWDRLSPAAQAKQQRAALERQVRDVALFSPWWRERLTVLGRRPEELRTAAALAGLPPSGERDVCPDGDPKGTAALVLQAGEAGFAAQADGPRLRRALATRLVRPGSYRAIVEADTRPTSFVWSGAGLRYPVASTRGDLDVVARAGARLWQVLGLGRSDVLVAGLGAEPTAQSQALLLAALAAGAPALAAGPTTASLAEALRLLPATVLALPSAVAAARLDDLDEGDPAALRTVRTVLLVGAPAPEERQAVQQALVRAGRDAGTAVLAVHTPAGHRLMWGECRAGGAAAGLHLYPDLELVQLADPESGEAATGSGGEPVLTQLGLRGTSLLRWRTGDLAEGLEGGTCRACHRTVPRLLGLREAALVPTVTVRSGERAVDLRGLAGALLGRQDLLDWRIVVADSERDGARRVVVHVAPRADAEPADVAVAVARDLRAGAGVLPTQVVVCDPAELPAGPDGAGRLLLTG